MDRRKQTFQSAAGWPFVSQPLGGDDKPASDTLLRQAGSRPPTVESDVEVPVKAALWAGFFAGAIVLLGFVLAGGSVITVVVGGGMAFFVVAGAAYWILLREGRKLLWATERALHTDLDGDGVAGKPAVLRVEISYKDLHDHLERMQILTIPGVTAEQLREFAVGVTTEGRGLAVPLWTGRGKPFSQPGYSALMSELMTAGLVVDAGGNVGRKLTRVGRIVLTKVAMAETEE